MTKGEILSTSIATMALASVSMPQRNIATLIMATKVV